LLHCHSTPVGFPWDAHLLERRQYREDLGNSPSGRIKLPVFPLFPCFPAPHKPLICPQSLLGSIHLYLLSFRVIRLTKTFANLVRLTVTSVSELETDWRLIHHFLALFCLPQLAAAANLPDQQQPTPPIIQH